MRTSNQMLNGAYFAIAVLLALLMFFIMKTGKVKSEQPAITIQKKNEFTSSNYTRVKKDTFINLVNTGFKNFAKVNEASGILTVNITGAKQKAYSFYNGNEDILTYGLDDFGFDIKMDKNNHNLTAQFEIEDECVHVPNDVLINLTRLYTELKQIK